MSNILKALLLFVVIVFTTTQVNAQDYKPKKVPSIPVNLQSLVYEIHQELIKTPDGKIEVGNRLTFALDMYDENIFEFLASRAIGRSGARSCSFLMKGGKMYFLRRIDWETNKYAQGVLYNDIKDKWEKYLREKARQ